MNHRNGTGNDKRAHTPRNRLQGCAGLPTCSPAHWCDYCLQQIDADRERRQQQDGDTQYIERSTQNSPPLKESPQTPPCDESLSTEYHVPEYLRAVWEAAQHMEPPAIAARYILPGIRKLIILCYALQQAAGNGTWFLACRHAAELIDAPFSTVSRWLGKLEFDGVLIRVSTGWNPTRGEPPSEEDRRANEYRYVGDRRAA